GHSFLTKYGLLVFGNPKEHKLPRFRHDISFRAHQAEITTGRSQNQFLDSVPEKTFKVFPSGTAGVIIPSALSFAAFSGLRLYIQESLAVTPRILCDSQEPLLSLACNSLDYADGIDTPRLLLDNGFRVKKDPDAFPYLM